METGANNKYKAFTSLKQSKKLSEILPLESADMSLYKETEMFPFELHLLPYYKHFVRNDGGDTLLPCWSLAALLNILPDYTLQNSDGTVFLVCDSKKPMISDAYNNPVDACVEMVLKLHELKML